MAEEKTPPGTTPTTPQDGSAPASGTVEGAGADGSAATLSHEEALQQLAEERRKNQQLLSEKSRVEEMRRQAQAGVGSTPPAPTAPQGAEAELNAAWNDTYQRALAGDSQAQLQVALVGGMRRVEDYLRQENEVSQLPAEQQAGVRTLLQERPHLSVADAAEMQRGRTATQKEQALAEREKKLREAEEALEAGRPTVGSRPVTARERSTSGDSMKRKDYYAQLDALEKDGRQQERRELVSRKREGKLVLTD